MKTLSPLAARLAALKAANKAAAPTQKEQTRPMPNEKWLGYVLESMTAPKKYTKGYNIDGERDLIPDGDAPKIDEPTAATWLQDPMTQPLIGAIYTAFKGNSKAQGAAHVHALNTVNEVIPVMEEETGWNDEHTAAAFEKLATAIAKNPRAWQSQPNRNYEQNAANDRLDCLSAICMGIAQTNHLAVIDSNDHHQTAQQMEGPANQIDRAGDTNRKGGTVDELPTHSAAIVPNSDVFELIERCITEGSEEALNIAKNEARKLHNRTDAARLNAHDFNAFMSRITEVERINRLQTLAETCRENLIAIGDLTMSGAVTEVEAAKRTADLEAQLVILDERIAELTKQQQENAA